MVVKMSAPGRSFGGVADYCLHDQRVPGEPHPRREFQKGGGKGKGKGKGKFEGEGEGKGRALNRYCGLFTDQGALEHLRAPQIVEMDDSNDPTGFIGDHQGSDLLLLHQVKCLDCQFPRSYRDRSWGHAF